MKARRWRMCLAPVDFEAMDHLMGVYCFGSRTNAARFGIQQQSEMAGRAVVDRKLLDEAAAYSNRAKDGESVLVGWSCWLPAESLKQLEQLRKTLNLDAAAAAFRYAIRATARSTGFKGAA